MNQNISPKELGFDGVLFALFYKNRKWRVYSYVRETDYDKERRGLVTKICREKHIKSDAVRFGAVKNIVMEIDIVKSDECT